MMPVLAPLSQNVPLTITGAEYEKFCEYFYRRTGISFGANKRYFVDKRLIDRMQKTRSVSFEEYLDRLRRHDAGPEVEHLVNLLTINETYFYREDYQLDCLVNGILPEVLARRRRATG